MMRPMIRSIWSKGVSTFWARIFWSIIPIVLSLYILFGVINIWQHKQLAEDQFMKRGHEMVGNLAYSSELGVFVEDQQLLETSMRVVVGVADVAYVLIYGERGETLAKGGRQVGELTRLIRELSAEEKALLFQKGQPFSKSVGGEEGRFVEFFAPILSEEGKMPDELLIGPLGRGPGQTQQGRQKIIGAVRLGLSLRLVEAYKAALLKLWAGLTVVFLAVSMLAIYAFSKRITRPIKQLTDQAEEIAAGLRSVKVSINSRDEIGRLASSFNKMIASLERKEAALQQKVVEIGTLYEIGQKISTQVALQPTLHLIVEQARDLLHGEIGLLALRQEGSDTFAMQASSGAITEALAAVRFRSGEGLGGRVVATGMPILVDNYLEEYRDSPFLEVLREADIHSAVAVPLKAREVVIGVLYVHGLSAHTFREEDNQLLSALADQAAIAIEQARHTEELERRVKERTQELQTANLQLEAASRHKSQFLASMSHELRTPLNAILGYTELIFDKIYGEVPEKIRDVLERVLKSGRHLLGLINDVLDLSKIEAGELTLSLDDYSMKDVVQTVFTGVESLAAEKKLALKVSVAPDLSRGSGDERRIAQVLLNLVGNAIKFTEVGEVKVQARASDGAFLVSVSDTGPGIALGDQQKIFEEFQQVDDSATKKKSGTGLGLAIAKRIIKMHGGHIWVESIPGQGSTFWFTLPVRVERQTEGT